MSGWLWGADFGLGLLVGMALVAAGYQLRAVRRRAFSRELEKLVSSVLAETPPHWTTPMKLARAERAVGEFLRARGVRGPLLDLWYLVAQDLAFALVRKVNFAAVRKA